VSTGLYGKVLWWLWLSGNGHVVCYEGGVDGTCLGLNLVVLVRYSICSK